MSDEPPDTPDTVAQATPSEKGEKPARKRKYPPSQKDRQKVYRRDLRRMNIHKPARVVTKENVDAIRNLRNHLRETWQAKWDKINAIKKLTPKQVEFARQYALNGRSNKCGAMRLAGYDSKNPVVLLEMANRMLVIPEFHELISAFEIEEKARMKINVEDVVRWFNDIATQAMASGDFTNANRAMENLAKYLQMFTERKEITHRVVNSKEELDTRIAELSRVLKEVEPEIEARLRIN